MLPAFGPNITLMWMPTGIAVAAFLRWGFCFWPAVTVGAVAVNLAVGSPWPLALAISVGNTLGPLLAAWILKRLSFHQSLDQKRDILFLSVAAIAGMLVSASLGVAALSFAGRLPEGLGAAWLIWWAGDTMGVITAAPLVLAFTRKELRAISLHATEFSGWLGVIGVLTWLVFVVSGGSGKETWSLAFLPLPLVAWAALRYGPIGTSVALIVVSVGAAYGTAKGHGPFQRSHPVEEVAVLCVFMATAAAIGWLISALHSARVQATGIQRLFEQALSDVSLGVLLADCDRNVTYANVGFTRLTGYKEEELLGKNCKLLHGPATDPATVKRIRDALQTDGYFEGEILNYRKDGSSFWNALLISPVCDDRGLRTGFLGIQRDVTVRKRLEQEREVYFKFFLLSTDPMCVTDPLGYFKHVNPAFMRLTGFNEEELLGRPFADFIHPEDRGRTAEEMKLQIASRPSVLFENRYICKDGSVVLLSWTGIFDKTDGVTYATARDITKLREAMLLLRESEERYRRIVDTAEEGIWTIDAEQRTDFVNPKMARMLGYTIEEMMGRPLHEFMDEDGRAIAELNVKRRQQGIAEQHDFKFRKKDGSAMWALLCTSPISDSAGAYAGALAMITDITDRKAAAAELERSFATLNLFINTVPAYISFVDAEERYRLVNRRYEDYFRRPISQIIGHRICDVQSSEAYVEMQPHIRAVLAGQRVRYESCPTAPDGKRRWFDVQYVPRREENGVVSGFFVLVFEITEHKLAEIEREKLDRKVRETQKLESLGVLAGGIAHDFNNLLTTILGNASLAASDLPAHSPAHESITQISEASLRAADLCKQMLAYSGRGRFVVQALDLGSLVAETAQMLQVSISKKATLRFQLGSGLPPIEADATQIRQVIMNLVINASEAIGDRPGVIHLTTGHVHLDRASFSGIPEYDLPDGEYVFMEVSDNGSGMSAETRAKIFDPFFTTKFTGRGLGLAAVLGIVRGHKGAAKVYSEPGRGTTFKLLFPAYHGATASPPPVEAKPVAWQGKGTVLVVDDEATMRSTVLRMIGKIGMEGVEAEDGIKALQIYRENPARFAVVLLDLTMPHMDGEQTFTELRRNNPEVRVVLMSGFNAQEALVRFTGRGLDSFLQKPFTIDALRAVLKTVIE